MVCGSNWEISLGELGFYFGGLGMAGCSQGDPPKIIGLCLLRSLWEVPACLMNNRHLIRKKGRGEERGEGKKAEEGIIELYSPEE